jgi:hypothetical protein
MLRSMVAAMLFVACIAAEPSFGNDRTALVGTWKLVSYAVEVQATGAKLPLMGQDPTGFATFLPDGRVFFIITGGQRQHGTTDHARADLMSSLVAYTGTYSVAGNTWTTKVDVAWDPEWVGTEQPRSFERDGERLRVVSPWRVMPNWADKGMTRSIIGFERAK